MLACCRARLSGLALAVASLLSVCGAAAANEIADFYRGKNVVIIVGYVPGGGYDQTARLLARHMGRHIPGEPNMIVQNMPGAGTVVAANHVNNVSPKDGTVIGMYADILPLAPLTGVEGVQFDPRKFGWLGSLAARSTPVLVLRKDSPATTIEGLRTTEVLMGASGPDASSSYALLLNEVLGFRLKVLNGYRGGTAEIDLAIERGEVHGRASMDWSRLKTNGWIGKGLAMVAVQMALEPHPDLKGIPTALDLAKTEEERETLRMVFGTNRFFRAFSTAGGVPDARLAALRAAFAKTKDDAEFLKDFNKSYEPGLTYAPPEEIMAFIERCYSAPKGVVDRAKKFLAP